MGRIYQQAEEVLVWLGPVKVAYEGGMVTGANHEQNQAHDVGEAVAMLRDMASGLHFHELPYFQRCASEECLGRLDLPRKSWSRAAKSLLLMLKVPWFTRTWVVQEIVLARRATMIHGKYSIPWEIIVAAWTNWNRHAQSCCGDCVSSLNVFDYALINGLVSETLGIEHARQQLRSENNLVRLLQSFCTRKASDNRDKIYGMLGVLPEDTALRITPIYTTSVVEVFTRFAFEMIQAYGWLAPLHLQLEHSIEELPSWVPDWTYCGTEPVGYFITRFLQAPSYMAGRKTDGRAVSVREGSLQVEGVRFDVVEDVSVAFTLKSRQEEHLNLILKWREFLDLDHSSDDNYVCGGTLHGAYQATIFANRYQDGTTCRESTSQDFEAWESHLRDMTRRLRAKGPSITGRLETPMAAHNIAVLRRRLCVTANGYIGLCPGSARVGDEVYVLDNAPAPIFLRPLEGEQRNGVGTRRFQALGHGYVHGIMDGEVAAMNLPVLRICIV